MSEDKNKKTKIGKITYYSVVVFSVAVIGAVSWFTVSRLGTINNIMNDSAKNNKTSYSSSESSYNKKKNEKPTPSTASGTESAANPVTDEPYTSSQVTAEKPAFTMPVDGTVLKPYSSTALQYSKTYGDMRLHEGIDIKCEEGSAVKSASNGTVTDIINDPTYGKTVIIDHGSGISVKYCGLKDVAAVKGSTVKSGDIIGTSGTVPCECKDGPHIHLEAADESGLKSILQIFGIEQ